ncbi:MAG: hypothetical protein ACJA1C_000100 [Crocinitomicaceae bacterium]|jgi:hypothetical protein
MKNVLKITNRAVILCVCAVLILASSCSTSNRSNFSKRKHTNFRTAKSNNFKASSEENNRADVTYADIENTAESVIENSIEPEVIVEDELTSDFYEELVEIEDQTIEENEVSEKGFEEEPRELLEGKQEDGVGNRNNFELLTEEGKAQRMIEFNALFNATAVLMAMAAIFGLMGIVFIWLLWFGAIFLFSGWIVSFVAATKVKRINAESQTKQFRNKLKWIQFANWVGIVACCVTIVLGLLLLIVWLSRLL